MVYCNHRREIKKKPRRLKPIGLTNLRERVPMKR
jgi:hypothetical protein